MGFTSIPPDEVVGGTQVPVTVENLTLSAISVAASLTDASFFSQARASCWVDGYLYVADYDHDRFLIMRASADQASLEVVGEVTDAVWLQNVRWIDVVGNIAVAVSYVGDSLVTIDVTDKSDPQILGHVQDHVALNGGTRVRICGRHVFKNGDDHMAIVDIYDPTDPQVIGSFTDSDLTAGFGMDIVGDVAFLTSTNNWFFAVDISDRTAPTLISKITSPGVGDPHEGCLLNCHSVQVDQGLAFIASSGYDGIAIVDVTDPANMVVIGSVETHLDDPELLGGAHTAYVLGHWCLVTGQTEDALVAVDCSDPTNPQVGGYAINAVLNGRSGVVVGTKFFVAGASDAIAKADLGGIDAPTGRFGAIAATNLIVTRLFSARDLNVHGGANVGPGGLLAQGVIAGRADSNPEVASVRALGTASTEAAAGNDSRFTRDEFELSPFTKAWSNTNWSTFAQASNRYNGGSRTSSAAQNDEVVFRLPSALRAGTWTFVLLHASTTNRGIYTIAVSPDAVTWTDLTTIDGYAVSLTAAVRTERTALTVPAGMQYLRLRMATKNGSSSAYTGEVQGLYGLRTGA
jgi:hypothetical protein